jgi:F0F1-type ATP synthase membrane subunit c/vacuolar-type H+-ATPase subunit K
VPVLTRWIFWFALFSSIGVYFFILQGSDLLENPSPDPGGPDPGGGNLQKAFLLIGLVLMALSLGVKHFVTHLVTADGKRRVPEWIFPAYIAALALGETPAILGLVLGFQGEELKGYLPLFVMAAITLALNAPPLFFPKEDS